MNLPKVDKRAPYHFLALVLLYFSAVTGLALMSMSATGDTEGITLFVVLLDAIGRWGTFIWGALSLVSSVLAVTFFFKRYAVIGWVSAFTGTTIWLFATWLYILDGFWDGALVAGVPNLLFWSWFGSTISLQIKEQYGDFNYSTWKSSLWIGDKSKRRRRI